MNILFSILLMKLWTGKWRDTQVVTLALKSLKLNCAKRKSLSIVAKQIHGLPFIIIYWKDPFGGKLWRAVPPESSQVQIRAMRVCDYVLVVFKFVKVYLERIHSTVFYVGMYKINENWTSFAFYKIYENITVFTP